MPFHVSNRQGASISEPTPEGIDAVLAELDGPVDDEHPDVSPSHDSERCLSAFPSGLLVWENVEEDDEPRHMTGVRRDDVRRLWSALAIGDLATIDAEDWQPGYGG